MVVKDFLDGERLLGVQIVYFRPNLVDSILFKVLMDPLNIWCGQVVGHSGLQIVIKLLQNIHWKLILDKIVHGLLRIC